VLRHPPLGDDFLDVQFSDQRPPLRLKFGGYILNRNARELDDHSLLRVRKIVVSRRQISSTRKTAGSRSCKIREGNRISTGVGLINEGKRKCVNGSRKRVCAGRPHVPRIFVQGNARQEACSPLRGDRGDGVSIEPPKRPGTVPPFLKVVAFGIRHAETGRKRREDERRRPKRLMGVDCKFIAKGKTLLIRDRQEQYGVVFILRLG